MSSSAAQNERQVYERNAFIRYLNHQNPRGFRMLWEVYLTWAELRNRRAGQPPLHPATPILQARKWRKPAAPKSTAAKKILFFSFTGWSKHIVLDGLLGQALQFRGAQVHYFSCGGIMPLCYIHNASSEVPPMPCGRCRAYAESGLEAFGFHLQLTHDVVTSEEKEALRLVADAIPDDKLVDFIYDELPVGYYASVSARWFLLTNKVDETEEMKTRIRQFIFLGLVSHKSILRLIEQQQPDQIIMVNGLHVPEQVVRAIATRHNIPYVCTERGYLANTLFATHNKSCASYPLDELWQMSKDKPLSADQLVKLNEYTTKRRYGHQLMDNLWESVREDENQLRAEVGLSTDRPVFVAFTNVRGDTAVIDRDIAYDDLANWIDDLVRCFSARPDVDLVFRIHPAETRLKRYTPRLSFGDYIKQKHPNLPPNIKVIPSSSDLSSYTLASISTMVLVYTSTMGLETTLMGKPTAVAASVHYRGRGFTFDIDRPEDLDKWIDLSRAGELPPVQLELAQRYAFTFFFRATLPLDEIIEETSFGQMRLKLTDLNDVQPGRTTIVDTICDAILDGKPFINPFLGDHLS